MEPSFTIGDAAERAGLAVETLRVWERRHGVPAPSRNESGHRRYSTADIELLRGISAGRRSGLTLPDAVERALDRGAERHSVFAALAREHPELRPRVLSKPAMIALTHAVEDETLMRAERPIMFGAFQRERFYRVEQERWREFARAAEGVYVFADFARPRSVGGAPVEIPLHAEHPLAREWLIVCDAGGYSVCLAGRERARAGTAPRPPRSFEAFWSVEPVVCATALRACAGLVADALPDAVGLPLRRAVRLRPQSQLGLATSIANRALETLGAGGRA